MAKNKTNNNGIWYANSSVHKIHACANERIYARRYEMCTAAEEVT